MNRNSRVINSVSVNQELSAIMFDQYLDSLASYDFDDCEIDSRIKYLTDVKGLSLVDACKQKQEELDKWERDTWEWLNNPDNYNSDIYSDVYKDYYGVRPR